MRDATIIAQDFTLYKLCLCDFIEPENTYNRYFTTYR